MATRLERGLLQPEVERAARKLRDLGYKATPQRVAIVKTLADQPYQKPHEIRQRCPQVSLVTVYRTLNLLKELGIARRLSPGDDSCYELVGGQALRFVCEPCGRIFDLPERTSEVERGLLELAGPAVEVTHVEVYGRSIGRCEVCLENSDWKA